MIDSETKAIVQDSCERWYMCHEYARMWSPGFDQRMAAEREMRLKMRAVVKGVNADFQPARVR